MDSKAAFQVLKWKGISQFKKVKNTEKALECSQYSDPQTGKWGSPDIILRMLKLVVNLLFFFNVT